MSGAAEEGGGLLDKSFSLPHWDHANAPLEQLGHHRRFPNRRVLFERMMDGLNLMATTEPPWLVTPEKVHAVVGRLIQMAHPKQIILFGSYARGEITEDSDLDVLIVARDEVENTRRESVRLRGALKEIEMPIDIVVVMESTFQKLSDTPGLIYEEVRRTGLLRL
jgi:predicted nucleotidyltransferase